MSSEISDFTPCTHAQSNILPIKYPKKTDDLGLGNRHSCLGKCVGLGFGLENKNRGKRQSPKILAPYSAVVL